MGLDMDEIESLYATEYKMMVGFPIMHNGIHINADNIVSSDGISITVSNIRTGEEITKQINNEPAIFNLDSAKVEIKNINGLWFDAYVYPAIAMQESEQQEYTPKEYPAELSELVGQRIIAVDGLHKGSDAVFITTHDETYKLYLRDDELSTVWLEDFENDIPENGGFVLSAEIVTSEYDSPSYDYIWHFYKIETHKGGLFMRWMGGADYFYSSPAYFVRLNKGYEG